MLEPDVAKIERYECERVNMLLTRDRILPDGSIKTIEKAGFCALDATKWVDCLMKKASFFDISG